MGNLVFRRAREEELEIILDLQVQVFTGEQGIPASMIEEFPKDDAQWRCALLDNKIVGAIASWKEEGKTHIGRFVVEPGHRGKHIGTKLIRHTFEDLFSKGENEFYMEAREITVKILVPMGAEIVGKPTEFYEGTVTPMILKKENYR